MYKLYQLIIMLCVSLLIVINDVATVQAQKTEYTGVVMLSGLSEEVKVYFDTYGVPHIYAQNERDAYFALGYLHAKERLAQLEIFRRLGTGRFAEIVGKSGIKIDKLVRTVGVANNSKRSAKTLREGPKTRFKTIIMAYLDGLNTFVEIGETPSEFEILGIIKEKFTLEDLFSSTGYLSLQLALGLRSELVVHQIQEKLGADYLEDLELQFGEPINAAYPKRTQKSSVKTMSKLKKATLLEEEYKFPSFGIDDQTLIEGLSANIRTIPGVSAWLGSNSWILSGKKTATGQVILCNDTHLGVGQPGFWYETHINFPGESLYGYIHPLNPAFILGHNQNISFGGTSLLVDDMDFYVEKYHPDTQMQIKQDGVWVNLEVREETIKVKGEKDIKLTVKSTQRGPIINEVLPGLTTDKVPVSMFWIYNKFPDTFAESIYELNIAKNLEEAQEAVSGNISPNLNIMYGDKMGNIAWWAGTKLIKRQPGINSKFILDGSNTKNEPLGYYDFSKNPKSINPPSGFLTTANNQPGAVDNQLYPGYYVAGVRVQRIVDTFKQNKKWTSEEVKTIFMDDISPLYVNITQKVLKILKKDKVLHKTPTHVLATQLLKDWKGGHGVEEQAPVVFNKLLFYLVKNTFEDELGEALFQELVPSTGFMNEVLSRTIPKIFFKKKSVWWDDVNTEKRKEGRKDIFIRSFEQTIESLNQQYSSTDDWRWGDAHQITYTNFTQDERFTVGPFEMSGGNDVINKMGFPLSDDKVHQISDQPSQRMLVDFSDLDNNVWGILPVGNSGHPQSPYYKNQVEMYNKGELRRQLVNKTDIENESSLLLLKVK